MAVCGLIKAKQFNEYFLTTNKPLKEHYESLYDYNNKFIYKSNDLEYAQFLAYHNIHLNPILFDLFTLDLGFFNYLQHAYKNNANIVNLSPAFALFIIFTVNEMKDSFLEYLCDVEYI